MNARGGGKALITVLAVGGVLGGVIALWARSEFASLRAQERQALAFVQTDAEASLQETAGALRQLLDETLLQESATPFYQYNNLYADPLSSSPDSVTPSPLARGPQSSLVLAHFQVDAQGAVTMPTLNATEPTLSNELLASAHQDLAAELADQLDVIDLPAPAIKVARVAAAPKRPRVVAVAPTPAEATPPAQPRQEMVQSQNAPEAGIQAYAENNVSNSYLGPDVVAKQSIDTVQRQGTRRAIVAPDLNAQGMGTPEALKQQAVELPAETVGKTQKATEIYLQQAKRPAPRAVPSNITFIVDPFEWMTLTAGAAPSLAAIRSVHAPTGGLRQGFVVSQAAISAFLGAQRYQPSLTTDLGAARNAALARPLNLRSSQPALAQWGLVIAALPELADISQAYATRQQALAMQTAGVSVLALLATLLAGYFVWQAERLARQRSDFAATAAHELRTPLASLQLHGELLAHGLGDASKSPLYAQRMSDEASRLGRVVANVLGYAQLEKNTLAAAPRMEDVVMAIELIVERHRAMFAHNGMALRWEAPTPVQAHFDRDALDRVLTNLLDNAEKYTRGVPDRSVEILLTSDQASVTITVTDNGPGMPRKLSRGVFHPFSRGTQTGPAGLGLGLALSRALCRGMGGELSLVPAHAAGAAFAVRLRRRPIAS